MNPAVMLLLLMANCNIEVDFALNCCQHWHLHGILVLTNVGGKYPFIHYMEVEV